jgi:hypothetical protein
MGLLGPARRTSGVPQPATATEIAREIAGEILKEDAREPFNSGAIRTLTLCPP